MRQKQRRRNRVNQLRSDRLGRSRHDIDVERRENQQRCPQQEPQKIAGAILLVPTVPAGLNQAQHYGRGIVFPIKHGSAHKNMFHTVPDRR